MRNLLTALTPALAVSLTPIAPGRGEEPPASLDGQWEIVGMVYKGMAQKFDGPNGGTVAIKGRELVINYPSGDGEGALREITLRPSKEPKEIDLRFPEVKNLLPAALHLGIYKLEGETLTIVLAHSDQERPKQFDARKDSKLTSWTLKRTKK
jgi:uncharacterized protein (TIGR03067 family)